MTADIPVPPRTIMEVYKMLPEGTLAELINGKIYMSPAPNTQHQRAIKSFFNKLSAYVEQASLGEIFFAPYDVYLDENANAVQPDLLFISTKNSGLIKAHGIVGSPDLIIEFLSPGNTRHHLFIKKELYEKFQVNEYWVVDPASTEVSVFQLVNGVFELTGKSKSEVFSPLFNHTFHF